MTGSTTERQGLPRIGVVGTGVAAMIIHIPAILDSDYFLLEAVCDTDPSRLASTPGTHLRRYASVTDMAEDPDIDAVVVCTPPETHFDIAARIIAGGKHVLMEKPMTKTADEAAELARRARAAGVELRVAHERRFQPTCERIRELLEEGLIGTPFYCGVHWATNVKLDPDRFIPEDAGGAFRAGYRWRWSSPYSGGGVLQDHIPHYVDLMRDWTGQQPIAVMADTKNVARDLQGWSPDDSRWEDMGVALIRFSAGLTLRLECSVVGRVLSPLWGATTGIGEWSEWGYIMGSEGQLVFDFLSLHASEQGKIAVWRSSTAGPGGTGWTMIEQPEPDRIRGSAPSGAAKDMFVGQVREFARAIRGEPNRSPDAYDGGICVAVIEAAYQAAETDRTVEIGFTIPGGDR